MPLPEPLLFIKPTSSYTGDEQVIEVPRGCEVYHEGGSGVTVTVTFTITVTGCGLMHAVEIAVVIGKTGRAISVKDAMEYVAGYGQ